MSSWSDDEDAAGGQRGTEWKGAKSYAIEQQIDRKAAIEAMKIEQVFAGLYDTTTTKNGPKKYNPGHRTKWTASSSAPPVQSKPKVVSLRTLLSSIDRKANRRAPRRKRSSSASASSSLRAPPTAKVSLGALLGRPTASGSRQGRRHSAPQGRLTRRPPTNTPQRRPARSLNQTNRFDESVTDLTHEPGYVPDWVDTKHRGRRPRSVSTGPPPASRPWKKRKAGRDAGPPPLEPPSPVKAPPPPQPPSLAKPRQEEEVVEDLLLVDAIRPMKERDFVNVDTQRRKARTWLLTDRRHRKPVLMFDGPSGTGKTSMVRHLAHHLNFTLVELNSSDERTYRRIASFLNLHCRKKPITEDRPVIVVLEELDGADVDATGKRKSGVQAVLDFLDRGGTRKDCHLIVTCNNSSVGGLRQLQPFTLHLRFWRPFASRLEPIVKYAASHLGVRIPPALCQRLCDTRGGDVRGVLNQLQFLVAGLKDDQALQLLTPGRQDFDFSNPFELCRRLFRRDLLPRRLDGSWTQAQPGLQTIVFHHGLNFFCHRGPADQESYLAMIETLSSMDRWGWFPEGAVADIRLLCVSLLVKGTDPKFARTRKVEKVPQGYYGRLAPTPQMAEAHKWGAHRKIQNPGSIESVRLQPAVGRWSPHESAMEAGLVARIRGKETGRLLPFSVPLSK